MIYDHIVKYNGEHYEAGQEVPIGNPSELLKNPESPFSDSDITFEADSHKYTEEELLEMTVKDIKKLAEDMGLTLKETSRKDVINEFLEKQYQ